MTANEFKTVTDFEANLSVGQEVRARWSAGSFGHFSAKAVIKRVNRASVRVTLTEPASTLGALGTYPAGRDIVCPLMADSGIKTWAYFNRVEPTDGYPVSA